MEKFYVNPDIRLAETLPASFYRSQTIFNYLRENVFELTWQWVGDKDNILPGIGGSVYPFVYLDEYIPEPMVMIEDKHGVIRCFSNVCTHRGNIIVHKPNNPEQLVCLYHGRQFNLDGSFKRMPEFKDAKDFPRACDSLHEFEIFKWSNHLFVGLNPTFDFAEVIDTMNERIGFLPINQFKLEKASSSDYHVNCHWALYCDNYLEGFHIPFVHENLNSALNYAKYRTLLYDHMSLQIGYSGGTDQVFDLPEGHIDEGKEIAAYYYWVFPNMMFNFYPWGLSINIVKPISLTETKVSFITYVFDENKINKGAGALLDKVQKEDEIVVEGVQSGIQSKYYTTGRFSPKMEKGVHHFHLLLSKYLNNKINLES
jgi:choline monooxygenase|tara:strand:+ start:3198 stop:4307 length:1110 start_codon:yes stop_codon:yes gene_type:complete